MCNTGIAFISNQSFISTCNMKVFHPPNWKAITVLTTYKFLNNKVCRNAEDRNISLYHNYYLSLIPSEKKTMSYFHHSGSLLHKSLYQIDSSVLRLTFTNSVGRLLLLISDALALSRRIELHVIMSEDLRLAKLNFSVRLLSICFSYGSNIFISTFKLWF